MMLIHEECQVLCISEHWKSKSQIEQIGIRDFKLVSVFCREEGQHGGVAMYVKNNVTAKTKVNVTELSLGGVFECAATECQLGDGMVIIVSIYRPPTGDKKVFFDKMEQLLCLIFGEGKRIIVVGDFNIELVKVGKTKNEFLSLMNSFNLFHIIKENTRVTPNASSCIDNIFTDSDFVSAVVFENFVSDHMAQKIVFETENKSQPTPEYKRIFSQDSKDKFLCCLRNQDWFNVYNSPENDTNTQWNNFINIYSHLFNQNFPLTLVRKKQKQKKIFTPELTKCKHKLDILLTLSRNSNTYKDAYKETKKQYDQILKKNAIKNYEHRINKSDNKMKSLWTITKEITGKSKQKNEIKLEGNSETIANNYNQFLVSVIPNLLGKLQSTPHTCNILPNNRSLYLNPVTSKEICKLAREIKNKHSSGVDELPTSIIKASICELQDVLCFLINNSFKNGIFPANLKVALIKPIYKKGDAQQMDSYRPISLLPGFSKLFELAMARRIMHFLNDCQILNNNQHGFLKGKSTQTAIFQFIELILGFFENGEVALGLFLDLSKAYDCLNRDILIKKLERYGVRGNALKWLKSYLSERVQIVGITKDNQSCRSTGLLNNNGIAQGSILGPILFIIFMNDIHRVNTKSKQTIINYADDTNLITGGKNSCQVLPASKYFFGNVSTWFTENRLILNTDKTNLICFKTKRSNAENIDEIKIGNDTLVASDNVKFLGVYINKNLDWSFHINKVVKKLSSVCYGIRVVGKYMNEKAKKNLYFANFESILKYGIIFWGRDSNIQNAFVTQKRVVRVISGMGFNQSCRNSFKSMGIMTVYALYIFECLMFIHRNANLFELKSTNSQYTTRSDHFIYPMHHLQLFQKSPHYMCIKLYNKLPNRFKHMQGQNLFKAEIRKMLIELEPYCINDYLDM